MGWQRPCHGRWDKGGCNKSLRFGWPVAAVVRAVATGLIVDEARRRRTHLIKEVVLPLSVANGLDSVVQGYALVARSIAREVQVLDGLDAYCHAACRGYLTQSPIDVRVLKPTHAQLARELEAHVIYLRQGELPHARMAHHAIVPPSGLTSL